MNQEPESAMKFLDKKTILFVLIASGLVLIFGSLASRSGVKKAADVSAGEQDAQIASFQQNYAASLASQNQNLAQAVNGLMVPANKVKRPFTVIIENHPQARPQSGLTQADIVYEALAEGGITRFLAVFQTQTPTMIGPVRSARTYFNDWAQELGGIYAHVGGNSDALADLKTGILGIANADQYFNDPYFWRTKTRKAPHNMYTSFAKLTALAQAHGFNTDKSYQDYQYKDDQPASKPQASTINIQFSFPHYAVQYKYNRASNSYKRFLAGAPALDLNNGKQIQPKVIAVQIIRNWPVQSDTLLAISMATKEGGNAYVFMDGKEISGTWKFVNGRTRFFDGSGNEIAFDRGQMWIEEVPPQLESQLDWK